MLAVTAIVLATAGAGASGAFDAVEPSTVAQATVSPPAVRAAVAPPIPPAPMTITYVLVGSEEERFAWDGYEDSVKHRGYLSR